MSGATTAPYPEDRFPVPHVDKTLALKDRKVEVGSLRPSRRLPGGGAMSELRRANGLYHGQMH